MLLNKFECSNFSMIIHLKLNESLLYMKVYSSNLLFIFKTEDDFALSIQVSAD